MRRKQQKSSWTVRPQLVMGLVALVVAVWGVRATALGPDIVYPLPQTQQVLSALIKVASPPVPFRPQSPEPRVTPDCVTQACLAITFDDGPSSTYTPQILDILQRHHARATFFVVGSHVPGNEGLLRRMYSEGHEIGNHSWSHVDFTTLNPLQMEWQINQTQAAVGAAGVPLPTLFRPPYGAVNPVVRSHVPLTMALWNIDPEDWKARNATEVINHVNATAKPGGIVDMHDIQRHTAEALDPLLTGLEQHYQLVTVTELLNLPAGQRGMYYGR